MHVGGIKNNTIYPNFSQKEGLLGHWLNQIPLNYDVPMFQIQDGRKNGH